MPLLASRAAGAASGFGLLAGPTAPTATGYFATAVKPALGAGGTGEGLTFPYTVSDSSGNIYTAGKTAYNSYAYLQKTSSTGEVVFLKHITNSTGNTFIEISTTNVFVVTGDAASGTGYVFVKFDYDGNVVYSRRISQSNSMIITGTHFDPATKYLYVAHTVYSGTYSACWSAINTETGTLPFATTKAFKFGTADTFSSSIVVQSNTTTRYLGANTNVYTLIAKDANSTLSHSLETGYVRSLTLASDGTTLYAALSYFQNSAPFGISKYATFPNLTYRTAFNVSIFSPTLTGTFNKIQLDSSDNPYAFGWANASSVPRVALIKFNGSTGEVLSSYSIAATTIAGATSSVTSQGGMSFSTANDKMYLSYSATTGDNSGNALITMSLKLSGLQTGTYSFPFSAGTMTTTVATTSVTMQGGGSGSGGGLSESTITYTVAVFTPTISTITNYDSKSVIIPA
jgi:hypothetical protein